MLRAQASLSQAVANAVPYSMLSLWDSSLLDQHKQRPFSHFQVSGRYCQRPLAMGMVFGGIKEIF